MASAARAIIICDGGSTDGCTETGLIRDLGVNAVIRKTGPGRTSAQLRLLFAYALVKGYRGMVHMDGNNKDDPSCIPDYQRGLEEGFDCVAGSRFRAGGQSINAPLYRELAIRIVHAPLISLAARRRFTDETLERQFNRGHQPGCAILDLLDVPHGDTVPRRPRPHRKDEGR